MNKKIAMITGGSYGIGAACARVFARHGYNVIVNGRNSDRLESVKKEIEKEGAACLTLCFDVCDRQAAQKCYDSLPQEWRGINVLVNNAGLALGLEKVYEGKWEDWDTMIDTNIKGLLAITRMVVPGMVERGSGHVINIGSLAGEAAYANGAVYCATKAAVQFISDGLRIDLADTNIKVTNVKPGLVETGFSITRFHGDTSRASSVYDGIQPLTADDIADVVWYAASVPAHVQIDDILVTPVHQANSTTVYRQKK